MIYKYVVNFLYVLAFLAFCREILVFMPSICNNTVKIQILTWCYAFTFVNHFNICILALLLYTNVINSHYFIFILLYLLEDNRRKPKHVRGLPRICASKYSAVVGMCTWWHSLMTARLLLMTSQNIVKWQIMLIRLWYIYVHIYFYLFIYFNLTEYIPLCLRKSQKQIVC